MNYLLDENLSPVVGPVMNILGAANGDSFLHIRNDLNMGGTDDKDIPSLCRENGCDALITINHKDFGAKKLLYQSLVQNGVTVVVVRPGRMRMSPDNQVSLISGKYSAIRRAIQSAPHLLIRVTPTDVVSRTLDELIIESTTRPSEKGIH